MRKESGSQNWNMVTAVETVTHCSRIHKFIGEEVQSVLPTCIVYDEASFTVSLCWETLWAFGTFSVLDASLLEKYNKSMKPAYRWKSQRKISCNNEELGNFLFPGEWQIDWNWAVVLRNKANECQFYEILKDGASLVCEIKKVSQSMIWGVSRDKEIFE